MGKRGRPQNDIDSVDKHSEQSNCSIYLGKNLSRWQEHRSACGGGAGSHEDFARHLLALHAEYCPRSPPAAPSQAKMNRGDGDGLDSAKDGGNHSIALDSDCLRLWRRIQRLAGYETAETEYLYWMLNMAEQILSQESCDGESTKDTSNKLRPLLPTVTSPKSPEMIPEAEEGQIIPESDENLNIAGESANLLPYTVSAPEHSSLPEYSVVNTEDIPVHDDTTSDSNTLPPMESNDNDEDIDVKPTLVADNDSPSQYSLKWPDQTSTILMAQNSSFDPHTSRKEKKAKMRKSSPNAANPLIWSREREEYLCQLWRQEEVLYNPENPSYRDTTIKSQIYANISTKLGINDVSMVKTHMSSMRTTMSKSVMPPPSGSSPKVLTTRDKRVVKLCSFLKGYIARRQKVVSSYDVYMPASDWRKPVEQQETWTSDVDDVVPDQPLINVEAPRKRNKWTEADTSVGVSGLSFSFSEGFKVLSCSLDKVIDVIEKPISKNAMWANVLGKSVDSLPEERQAKARMICDYVLIQAAKPEWSPRISINL